VTGTAVKKQISLRKLCILGLLAANDAGEQKPQPLAGRTRLQKLLRLITKELKTQGDAGEVFKFDYYFEPEKFGPADLQMYQDLDFLNAMGLIAINGVAPPLTKEKTATNEPSLENLVAVKRTTTREPTLPEEEEENELSFEYLMGRDPEELLIAEAEDEEMVTQYEVTARGQEMLQQIRERLDGGEAARFDRVLTTCAQVRGMYGGLPLKTLLRHVYTQFPDETTKSIIKNDLF
jgi:hypothetical protein